MDGQIGSGGIAAASSDLGSGTRLGIRVTKVSDIASDPDALFVVTGKVLITLMVGEVTTVIATTTTLNLRVASTNESLCQNTTITNDILATMYILTGDIADDLNGTGLAQARVASVQDNPPSQLVVGLAGGSLTIEQNLNAAGTGAITWDLFYIPLEDDAKVEAAA